MKKFVSKFIAITLSMCILLLGGATSASADSKHLLIINSKTNTMGYYVDNKLVKEFQVGTGKYGTKTPTGKFKIVNKIVNRPYYSGGIPGGDPRNPLGDRWLGLHVGNTYGTTYGIHGTNNENSIGGNVSGGCIRMYNKEVRWLFDRVPTGTTVLISETSDTYSQIAAKYNINIDKVAYQWKLIDGSWYYLNESEHYQRNSWKQIGNKWYYFNADGIMQTGWKQTKGTWYYLRQDGSMVTGWEKVKGTWYYFNEDGSMATGWNQIKGTWYYLNTDGSMETGWGKIKGTWYYFNADGSMATGWIKLNNKWYYLESDGVMVTGWKDINNKRYHLKENGEMSIGWLNLDGTKYYLNQDGSTYIGWLELNGKKYYCDLDGGIVVGDLIIANIKYTFNIDGELVSESIVKNPENPEKPEGLEIQEESNLIEKTDDFENLQGQEKSEEIEGSQEI